MAPRLSPAEYRQLLIATFPPEPYHGPITDHDDCDDGRHLRANLSGRRWDELTPGFLFHASVALPLLHHNALRAFIPAWLLHSASNTNPDDITTAFTLYFPCPGNPSEGWRPERASQLAALFTPPQREALASLLRLILAKPAHHHLHAYAQSGLHHWPA